MTDAREGMHDPGGKSIRPLPSGVIGKTIYGGPNCCYRYVAEYEITSIFEERRTLMTIGMNPSMARADCFDPTVDKVWRCGRRWGFNRLLMMNGHAYRATDQARLLEIDDPIGPDNDGYLLDYAKSADMILMAYGTPRHKQLQARGPAVARMLLEAGHNLHMLRLSKDGVPWHPLYIPDAVEPQPWDGPGK